MKKTTLSAFAKRKREGEKIVVVTAYDAPTAAAAADAGIDILLVGDSLGPTVLGYPNTLPVTMEQMLSHAAAVRRGAPDAFVIFDMPFMSYQESRETALRNAGRALKEVGCDAVKLEGGAEQAALVAALVECGIPVMAHTGLLPQHVQAMGGYRIQGRTPEAAERLLAGARELERSGAFSLVLECIPAELGTRITEALEIPTIGIGSGAGCSGQVQVMNDLLGIFEATPKHARRYAEVGRIMREALSAYASEVRSGVFPDEEHSFR